MKLKIKDILKGSIKFVLPENCPDEIIDFHVEQFDIAFKKVIKRTKSILKIKK